MNPSLQKRSFNKSVKQFIIDQREIEWFTMLCFQIQYQ